jgi:SAM-dependent methyltransferase
METHSSQLADDVVRGYAWDQVKVVVDVGGGTGALLARILSSCPQVRGVLVDLVAESDEANRVLRESGVSSRCQAIARNFFDPLPTGGDVYLLRNIVHDWPDQQAAAILRRCGEAAGEAGRVLVVERVMTAGGDQRELTGMDLRMLTLFGSRERRLEEFHAIATEARLMPSRTMATSSDYWLLEYRTL